MAASIFTSIFGKTPSTSNTTRTFPYPLDRNPYTSRTRWPPDFTQLSQKHQFRLERRYRRRSKLKYARPTWNKVLKLTQWGAIGFVVVYGVFWLEIEDIVPRGSRMAEQLRERGGGMEGKNGEVRVRRRTIFDGFRAWWESGLGGELRDARGGGNTRREDGRG